MERGCHTDAAGGVRYKPVAGTLHCTLNVTLELEGKLGKVVVDGAMRLAGVPGQVAPPAVEQDNTLQLLRPVLGVSCTIAPLALPGPRLLNVTV